MRPSKTPKVATSTGGLFENYPIKLFDRQPYLLDPENARETAYYEKPNHIRQPQDQLIYNRETLGFRLDSTSQIATFRDGDCPISPPINDSCDYLRALMSAVLNVQGNQYLHSGDWTRTVYIDTLGIGTVDFNLPDDRKQALLASGSAGANRYFTWYVPSFHPGFTFSPKPHDKARNFKHRHQRGFMALKTTLAQLEEIQASITEVMTSLNLREPSGSVVRAQLDALTEREEILRETGKSLAPVVHIMRRIDAAF